MASFLLSLIIINYAVEIIYIVSVLSGVEIWTIKKPLDDPLSYNLYLAEALFAIQFTIAWSFIWFSNLKINHSNLKIGIVTTVLTAIGASAAIQVFRIDPHKDYPTAMVNRRLVAFQFWIICTLLSCYLTLTVINTAPKKTKKK